MMCEDRESDLLLFGLGEISLREGWKTALHVMTCPRCRARQKSLIAANQHIAEALRPNAGDGGGAHPRIRRNPLIDRLTRTGVGPLLLLALLAFLIVTVGIVSFEHSRAVGHSAVKDDGCTPGLRSDKCR